MKIWNLLEAECHHLDLELAMMASGRAGDREGFLAHAGRIQDISQLEEERDQKVQYASTLDEACTALAVHCGEDAEPVGRALQFVARKTHDKINAIVSQLYNFLSHMLSWIKHTII